MKTISEIPHKDLEPGSDEWDVLEQSEHAKNTINPIRKIVDFMSISPNPDKKLLKLHIGDPTFSGEKGFVLMKIY